MVMTYGVRCYAKMKKKNDRNYHESIYHERVLSNLEPSFIDVFDVLLIPLLINHESLQRLTARSLPDRMVAIFALSIVCCPVYVVSLATNSGCKNTV